MTRPPTTNLMFLRKNNKTGRVVRHKARLVVRGFEEGKVDRTCAIAVDFSTFRTYLSIESMISYFIEQMDIKTAFPHANTEDEFYISAPPGVKLRADDEVVRFRKKLYGLKQNSLI